LSLRDLQTVFRLRFELCPIPYGFSGSPSISASVLRGLPEQAAGASDRAIAFRHDRELVNPFFGGMLEKLADGRRTAALVRIDSNDAVNDAGGAFADRIGPAETSPMVT
jgi:hypothetical protein